MENQSSFSIVGILLLCVVVLCFYCLHQRKTAAKLKYQLDKNKKNVIAFYELMFNENKPREAIEKYAGDTYIQHNPHVSDGKEGFINYFIKMGKEYPGKQVYVKRSIAEGNLVVLHCLQVWPGDKDFAGIDIFRVDTKGKIVEHWDVLQIVPSESKNENTLF
jgi:predicted SnoaL-like aldol condensation-catalyzing enzyme